MSLLTPQLLEGIIAVEHQLVHGWKGDGSHHHCTMPLDLRDRGFHLFSLLSNKCRVGVTNGRREGPKGWVDKPHALSCPGLGQFVVLPIISCLFTGVSVRNSENFEERCKISWRLGHAADAVGKRAPWRSPFRRKKSYRGFEAI